MGTAIDVCGHKLPKPLQAHVVLSVVTLVIFLANFLFYLLVGISLPIIKSIYIIEVAALDSMDPVSNAATSLFFGVWGVCAYSTINSTVTDGECFGPQLGYLIPSVFLSDLGLSPEIGTIAETGLLVLLSLHLVAAGLSIIMLVLSLFLHSHIVAISALVVAVITAIVATVVFAADVSLVVAVQDNIDSLFSGSSFSVQFGNGVWMVLVAVILTWTAVVLLSARACYCCGVRRPKTPKPEPSESTKAEGSEKSLV